MEHSINIKKEPLDVAEECSQDVSSWAKENYQKDTLDIIVKEECRSIVDTSSSDLIESEKNETEPTPFTAVWFTEVKTEDEPDAEKCQNTDTPSDCLQAIKTESDITPSTSFCFVEVKTEEEELNIEDIEDEIESGTVSTDGEVTKRTLQKQVKKDTGKRPYSCDVCDSKFTRSNHLKRHKEIHSEEKSYSCHVCDSKFNQKSDLKQHIKTHSGERRYYCNTCNSKFTRSYHLKMHIRIHTGEKPYSCSLCESKFSRLFYLKQHMRVHLGDKPYTCNVCNSKFTQSSHLNMHMKIHTRKKVFNYKVFA